MRKWQASVYLALLLTSGSLVVADNSLDPRKAAWRDNISGPSFHFHDEDVGLVHSLAEFQGDCEVAFVYLPSKTLSQMRIELRNDGKVITNLEGGLHSSFVGKKGAFYFAEYNPADCGCTVRAYDSHTGKKLWEQALAVVPPIPHTMYSNKVIMTAYGALPSSNPLDCDTIVIKGNEFAGNYEVALDAATGSILAQTKRGDVTPDD